MASFCVRREKRTGSGVSEKGESKRRNAWYGDAFVKPRLHRTISHRKFLGMEKFSMTEIARGMLLIYSTNLLIRSINSLIAIFCFLHFNYAVVRNV